MLTAILYDLETQEDIADITEFCTTLQLSERLSRPTTVTATLPGDTAHLIGTYGDDFAIVHPGRRGIKVKRDDVLRANGILQRVDPSGDENTTEVILTSRNPLWMFVARFVRVDGNIADPNFPSPISGPDILKLAVEGTTAEADDGGIGPLPINIDDGVFDSIGDGAVDLGAELTDFPMRLSDLLSLLTNTGVMDVVMDPVEEIDDHGLPVLGRLNAVSHYGSDKTGSVHLDYGMGDFSVAKIRRTFDIDDLCNRLYYYLGQRLDLTHWQANITATEAGLDEFFDLQIASRENYLWVYEDVKIFNEGVVAAVPLVEQPAGPAYHELWKTEVTLRTSPRQRLYLTAARGEACPFKPYDDYYLGDTIAANVADIVGPGFTDGQIRIYGFDITQERNGPEETAELIVSPDGL